MADNITRFTYTGEEIIPREATHIFVDAVFIPERAFAEHPNVAEVVCSERVKKIEAAAFCCCPSLRRVIMPGVKIVWGDAFDSCAALTDVECGKLEIIKPNAFDWCESLRSINLPSVRIVGGAAFHNTALTDVKFGSKLERIRWGPFMNCASLERITIPLKDGLITNDYIFQGCEQLKNVDLVEGEVHETIAALHLEEWRNDMNEEIDSINQILPNAPAGDHDDDEDDSEMIQHFGNPGEKTRVIQWWIRSVIVKINYYKAVHQRILDEAANTLQLALPHDLLINSVIPFLALPEHTFELVNPRNGRR